MLCVLFMYQNYNFCMYICQNSSAEKERKRKNKFISSIYIKVYMSYKLKERAGLVYVFYIYMSSRKERSFNMSIKSILNCIYKKLTFLYYDEYGEPVYMSADDIKAGLWFCLFMIELFVLYAIFA